MVSLPYFINNKLKIEFKVFFIFFKTCYEMCMVIFYRKNKSAFVLFTSLYGTVLKFDLCIVETKSEVI